MVWGKRSTGEPTHHGEQAQRVVAPGCGHRLVPQVLQLLLSLMEHLHALRVLILQLSKLRGEAECQARTSEHPGADTPTSPPHLRGRTTAESPAPHRTCRPVGPQQSGLDPQGWLFFSHGKGLQTRKAAETVTVGEANKTPRQKTKGAKRQICTLFSSCILHFCLTQGLSL